MSLDKINKRKVDINNFDNVGKILMAEKKLIDDFIKNRKGILDKNGVDKIKEELIIVTTSLFTVVQYIESRIKELERLNKLETEKED